MKSSWIKTKLNTFEKSEYRYNLLRENQFELSDGVLNYYEYQRINTNYKNALLTDLANYRSLSEFWNNYDYKLNPSIIETLDHEYKDLMRNFIIAPYHEFWWYMPRGLFMNIPAIGRWGSFFNTDLPVVGCARGKLFSEVFFRCEFGERLGVYIPAAYLMPEVPRLTVFRQYNWGYIGFLFSKSLYVDKISSWDVGLADLYKRFKISSSWYHGFKIRKSMGEWGMRTEGSGLRTSAIIRQVYSKKSYLMGDCFSKLYFNRIIANKVFIALTGFSNVDHREPVFTTAMLYTFFPIKQLLCDNIIKIYEKKINYNKFCNINFRFYTYLNTLGSSTSVSRLHNIINFKHGLTYALIRFSKYNFNVRYHWASSGNIVKYKNKHLMIKRNYRRNRYYLLNELRLINNRKQNILSKLKASKYIRVWLDQLCNINERMEYVDELQNSRGCSLNYFIYLFLKILCGRRTRNTLKCITRSTKSLKYQVKLNNFCEDNKFKYAHSNISSTARLNKFNKNENKFLFKQLLFHSSLLDSVHSTSYNSHRNINIITNKSEYYIRLLKSSRIFNRKANLSGVGRFYRYHFKRRRKYFNKRFWFKRTRQFWRASTSFKRILGGTKQLVSSGDYTLGGFKRFTEFYRINRLSLRPCGSTVFNKLFSIKSKKSIILRWMNYLAFITRVVILYDYDIFNVKKNILRKYVYSLIYVLRKRVNKFNYLSKKNSVFGKYYCRYPISISSYIKDE